MINNDYFYKYMKYKNKYIKLKTLENNLKGGGKRYLKQETEDDPLLITPTGKSNTLELDT